MQSSIPKKQNEVHYAKLNPIYEIEFNDEHTNKNKILKR